MFGFGKKAKEMKEDPEKGLDYAEKKLNKGVTGFMTKAFLGKDFVDDMNRGKEALLFLSGAIGPLSPVCTI